MAANRSTGHVQLSSGRREALGEAVKSARSSSGLTQERLASLSSLTTEHIQRIERGVANPTLATMFALCDALGVSARDLLPD